MGKKKPHSKRSLFENGLLASAFEGLYPSVNIAFVFFLIFRCLRSMRRALFSLRQLADRLCFLLRMQMVFFFSLPLFSSFIFSFLTGSPLPCGIRSTWADRATGAGFSDWLCSFSDFSFRLPAGRLESRSQAPGGSKVTPLRQWRSHCGSAVAEETKAVKTWDVDKLWQCFQVTVTPRQREGRKTDGRTARTSLTHTHTHAPMKQLFHICPVATFSTPLSAF